MSIIEDSQSTTFAALPHDDLTVAATPHEDLTVAEAWASSPLGDPRVEDGSLSEPAKFEVCPAATVTARPRSRGTNALAAGAVVAALGAVAGLGLLLIDGSGPKEHKPVVVPNSSVGSVTPQAPSAVAPPPVAPAAPTTPPDAGHVSPGPAGGAEAPVVIAPAPAPAAAPADPGSPPPPPNVTVNVPPVIVPVPVPIPVPPQHDGNPPAPSGHGPIQCYACHPPQPPVHPLPVHPLPVQQQPGKN
ncbi:hypothetical protein BRW65_06130 [Mycobacterium paraffinicum]|uniref:Uncharacterized protein n=1 Tax=Mycobacterium paraffinicum TaxID=53378 RepID=A0A1Q4HYP0_9MYCO|nr:hypothetical protein [Mycobacterium paraffinicum]OJZ74805.1 hypothetical protein BRW65_06130 [Mycobacterium paraffinicum]